MQFVFLYQKVDGLLRQRHLADGVFRLRLRHIQLALHAGDLLVHRQNSLFHIQVLPLERQQFTTAQTAGQFQIEHGQDTIFLRFLKVPADFLRRQDGHLFLVLWRDATVLTGVVRDEPFLHRLLQCRLQHRVDAPHEGVGQGFVILLCPALHPAVFFRLIIHSLDVDGRELLELDPADGWDDVMFDDPLIALGGVIADVGFAVSLKPQAAPLRYGVVAGVIERCATILPNGFRQLLLALRLGLGGHAFLNGPAGDRVDALGVSALPAATGLFTDAALAVGSFLCHIDPSLVTQTNTTESLK